MGRLRGYLNIGLANPLRFFRLVLSRLLLYTGLCTLVTINLGGYRIRFFPTRYSADLWYPSTEVFNSYSLPMLKAGDIAVDVGANIGITALLFRKYVGPQGRVLAFEPHPETFRYLQQNIAINGLENIVLINSAVGSSEREVELTDNRPTSTFNSIANADERGITVVMETLDQALERHGVRNVKLLKIDCEGYEKLVLEGAERILERTDFIIFEAIEINCNKYEYSVIDIVELLARKGFQVFMYDVRRTEYSPFDADAFRNCPRDFLYDLFGAKDFSSLDGFQWS